MNRYLSLPVVRVVTAAALLASAAGAALCVSTTRASAQSGSYPERRITFVVPYQAGGATDVSARLLANKLSDAWKQPVVVENKSGAGGVVGNDYVAKAQPDGYTVLIAITQIIQAPSLVELLVAVEREVLVAQQVLQEEFVLAVGHFGFAGVEFLADLFHRHRDLVGEQLVSGA